LILCSHGNQVGGSSNYEEAAKSVLPGIPTRNDGKTTLTSSNCKFHCIVENGIIYMCAAKSGFETRPCFAFLTEIKDQFRNSSMPMRVVSAGSHEFDSEFNNVLKKEMDRYSKPGAGDQLSTLQGQVKEVTGVMSQNIESVVQRGEKLDDLMDKTEDLESATATFAKTASKIKKKYWWKNLKMKIIIAIVVFVIIVGITLAIVFGSGALNGSSDDDSSKTTPAPTSSGRRRLLSILYDDGDSF